MSTRIALAIICLSAVGLAACATQEGNRDLQSENRTVSAFTQVDVNDAVEVTLTIDAAQSGDVTLEVSAESNLLPYVVTQVSNDLLGVGVSDSIQSHLSMTVVGTVSDISNAQVHNAALLVLEGIDRESLTVGTIDGASLTATGTVDHLIAGSSNGASLSCAELTATTAEVGLSQGGTATLCVSGQVTGSVDTGAVLTVLCGGDTSGVSTSDGGTIE
jgi:hypothetical protein